MSYDVWLVKDRNSESYDEGYVELGNYTSNCGGMFTKAMSGSPWTDITKLGDLCGRKASEVHGILAWAINIMVRNPESFRSLNPENGWGNFNSFLKWLVDIALACAENPELEVEVSW